MGAYYMFFRSRGILYKNSPVIITGWYLVCLIVVAILFFLTKKSAANIFPNGLLLFFLTGAFLFWLALGRRCDNKKIQMNWFITKSAEILFQQGMILWLVDLVSLYTTSLFYQIVTFSLIFLIAHLPIYLFFSPKKASTYVVPSVLGGLVFMIPILFLQGGIYISIGIHFLFYAFLAYQGTVWGSEKHFSNF